MTATRPRYEQIGSGYARTRRADPELHALIDAALGSARTVVNVGAGAGSYEPPLDLDSSLRRTVRHVIAVEPSDVMAAQRPAQLAPAIRAGAASLPLRDGAVDAAMAVLTIHHWDADTERGVRELRRVARGPVVIVTFDAAVHAVQWLVADYLPEVAALDLRTFPTMAQLARWLPGDRVTVTPVPIARDTPDWTFAAFWAHPERVLDPQARAATSGFARMPAAVVDRAVSALRADLDSGAWDARHGHLRRRDAHDAGLRLVVARPR